MQARGKSKELPLMEKVDLKKSNLNQSKILESGLCV